MANPKNTVMIGRTYAKPALRKFNGGEVVRPTAKAGRGKKWIVENDYHECDHDTPSRKHSYYRCRRGQWVEYFRSDKLVPVSA